MAHFIKRENAGRVELGRGFENLRCCPKLMIQIQKRARMHLHTSGGQKDPTN